ncbi:hypothetical protein GCM10010406_01170 [Streptomyces thermolineatus]|uniref:Uncharacterized protein n=1 Tax=Streptomyces thermolineatus TaxID=44033 RepID=A0ABN3KTI8_9ACTN
MPKTDSGMELSKMGPPEKRSTATISRRRREESLRPLRPGPGDGERPAGPPCSGEAAAAGHPAVAPPGLDSWLMALKPPSVLASSGAVKSHSGQPGAMSVRFCTFSPPWYPRSNLLCLLGLV